MSDITVKNTMLEPISMIVKIEVETPASSTTKVATVPPPHRIAAPAAVTTPTNAERWFSGIA